MQILRPVIASLPAAPSGARDVTSERVHRIRGVKSYRGGSGDAFLIEFFRGVNSGWKYVRYARCPTGDKANFEKQYTRARARAYARAQMKYTG